MNGRGEEDKEPTDSWRKTVGDTADIIGEMSLETAEGKRKYSYKEIAGSVFKAGIFAALCAGPDESRVEEAKVIYEELHDPNRHIYASLSQAERGFWINIAQATTSLKRRSNWALRQLLAQATPERNVGKYGTR